MVIFDILQLNNDSNTLYLEAHINEAPFFEGYTITDVFINTEECFLETGVDEEHAIYHKSYEDKPTVIREVITNEGFKSHLLFVYVRVEPKANACTECLPCALDNKDTLGVTFDEGLLYNAGLSYIKELADNCSIPQGFNDFVLNWEGFKLLLESEHYIDAITMFNKLFKNSKITSSSNCGCNGKLSS